jgi:FMN phosphatase YigB (HAD superfamily)
MRFKAMLFDAGDVIYHRPRRGLLLSRFLARLGLSEVVPDAGRLAEFKQQAHAGIITREKYQDDLLRAYGVLATAARLEGRHVLDTEQADIEFFDGVPGTLRRLKEAGMRLGVVTNTFNTTAEKLQWFRPVGIDDCWDCFATSCELKICKPDPRIYLAALEPIGVTPREAAFVGHAAAELLGAKSVGLTTIAFNRDTEAVTADHIIATFTELLSLAGL